MDINSCHSLRAGSYVVSFVETAYVRTSHVDQELNTGKWMDALRSLSFLGDSSFVIGPSRQIVMQAS